MKKRFSRQQSNMIFACMLLYSTAYLNRLNLSAALGSVMEAMNLSATRAGSLSSAFAITYAAGQMINGMLVDRLNPVRHMMLGLLGSAVCNMLLAASINFEMMFGLCLLNGLFQSMLWTPIVRLMAMHFSQEERPKANILISITLIIGHVGAWAISGYMSGIVGWRASFLAPSVVAVPVMLIANRMLGVIKAEGASHDVKIVKEKSSSIRNALGMYWISGFIVMLIVCVLFGFVRDGIRTWAPQILGEVSGSIMNATTFSLIIPVINALGIILSYVLQRMHKLQNRRIVAVLMFAGMIFCALLCDAQKVVLCALMMGLACACMSGVEPLMTTLIPMEYEREKLIGLSAGLMDSLIYVGSALAGVMAGFIRESMGLNALFIAWAGSALVASVLALRANGMYRSYRSLDQKSE